LPQAAIELLGNPNYTATEVGYRLGYSEALMVDHVLDNPALAALNHGQANLGRTSELAAVYDSQVSPLAGINEPSADALAQLARLVSPGTGIGVLATQPKLPASAAWRPIQVMQLHQMVCESPPVETEPFDELGAADAPAMVALAELTEPGPFLERTIEMGRYIGVRDAGRLVAMAGERMKPPGWVEISGVCTHSAARGQGYASRMVTNLVADCIAHDQRAFLHVVVGSPSEKTAIGVYESVGFRRRKEIYAHVLLRDEEAP
jgi:ribosomal protein S18 acetylase RimI-like enzyme